MLSHAYRIPTHKFPEVTRGKVLNHPLFRVVIFKDSTLTNPQCAVIVSNKLAKTAVVRNKIRRQVYEVLGMLLSQLPKAYISVFPKKVPIEYSEIQEALQDIFKK